jgi:hypothetical protein
VKRLANPWTWAQILALLLLLSLGGCAGAPKAPTCEGPYRSLNPAHYAPVQESTSADVPILFPPNETQGS